MLITPKTVYCPFCMSKYLVYQLMSGNTCGAEFYSDGYLFAPMLPNVPKILKCKKCKNYSWIEDCITLEPDNKSELEDDILIENLDLLEFIEVFQKNIFIQPEREFYLRCQIRFLFNDQYRYNISKDYSDQIIEFCQENLLKLIPFYEKYYNPVESKYLKAEIFRNLGKFYDAKKLFQEIDSEELQSNVTKLLNEIEKKNRFVIKL